jgi:hypothetical protein
MSLFEFEEPGWHTGGGGNGSGGFDETTASNVENFWCHERIALQRHRGVKAETGRLAQNAIEAAIEAIERNGYRLSLPMQFRFPNESEAESTRYPQGQEEISRVEERGLSYSVKRRKTS